MERLLNIKQIRIDEKLYPRSSVSTPAIYTYANAMRNGDVFPLIKVAQFGKRLILVDGNHRIEAKKLLKEKYIKAEILKGLTKEQIYIEAIKSNITNGCQFSPYERRRIIVRLQDMKYDDALISKIIHIPMERVNKFIAKSISTDISGERTVLKAGINHLSEEKDIPSNINRKQDKFSFNEQHILLDEVITLLENPKMFNMTPMIVNRLLKIKNLINKLVIKTKR